MLVGRPLAGLGSPQLPLSWCSRMSPVPPVLRFLPGDVGMLRPACPGLWWRCSEQYRTHKLPGSVHHVTGLASGFISDLWIVIHTEGARHEGRQGEGGQKSNAQRLPQEMPPPKTACPGGEQQARNLDTLGAGHVCERERGGQASIEGGLGDAFSS